MVENNMRVFYEINWSVTQIEFFKKPIMSNTITVTSLLYFSCTNATIQKSIGAYYMGLSKE